MIETPILITDIHPNNWNPNRMTAEEHAELIAEIKHLGRIPKPLVLRHNEKGYEIVDGEHTYDALLELDWKELLPSQYEIIEADDFEAMRQTYKRNQHGTHDKLKEGILFKRMMTERGISQRDLAEQVEISEGTIRNALEYVKALEMRNCYADWQQNIINKVIAGLSVRDIRALNEMPLELGNMWLDGGTKEDDLPGPELYGKYYPKLSPVIPLLHSRSCKQAVDRLHEIGEALRLWGYYSRGWGKRGQERKYNGGLCVEAEDALPYLKPLLKSRWLNGWNSTTCYYVRKTLEAISRPNGNKVNIVLPLDTFKAWIDYPEGLSINDFEKKLQEATAEIEAPVNGADLWRDQLQKYAPATIKNSSLPVEQAYKLWQSVKTCEEDGVKKDILDKALAQAIQEIGPKSQPDAVLSSLIQVLTEDTKVKEEVSSLGDKAAMLAKAKEFMLYIAQTHALFLGLASETGGDTAKLDRRLKMLTGSMQPLLDRLATLQEPELALIIAMMTGKDWLKIWATAIGWKFDGNDKGATIN